MVTPPIPDPTIGYVPIGVGQRCLEAILMPIRRELSANVDGHDDRRGLRLGPNATYPSAEDCYECAYVDE